MFRDLLSTLASHYPVRSRRPLAVATFTASVDADLAFAADNTFT
jgi:hypothetical protein